MAFEFRMIIEKVFRINADEYIVAGVIEDGIVFSGEWIKIKELKWDKKALGYNAQVIKTEISPNIPRYAGLFLKYGSATKHGGTNLKPGQIITKWISAQEDF